jgi:hypothetical protein
MGAMPESFLGDGLIFEDLLPLAWSPGPLVEGPALGRMNADNHQLLVAEASLDDVRVHDALKDESPALVHELQRLEFKLNILLRLTAELAVRNSTLPPPQRVRVSPQGLEWFGDMAPALRGTGVVSAYINAALPQPLKVSCQVEGERMVDGQRVAQLLFVGLSDTVVDSLEKLIFRHHRRLVAGSRLASR